MITDLSAFFAEVREAMMAEFDLPENRVHFAPLRQANDSAPLEVSIKPGSFAYEDDIGSGYRGQWGFAVFLLIAEPRETIYEVAHSLPTRTVNRLYDTDFQSGVNNLQVESISEIDLEDTADRPRGIVRVSLTVYVRLGDNDG